MLFIFLLFRHHIVALKSFRVNLARLILVFLTIQTSQQLYRFYFETKVLKKQTIQEFRNPPLNLLEKRILSLFGLFLRSMFHFVCLFVIILMSSSASLSFCSWSPKFLWEIIEVLNIYPNCRKCFPLISIHIGNTIFTYWGSLWMCFEVYGKKRMMRNYWLKLFIL